MRNQIDENRCFTARECVEFILGDLGAAGEGALLRHSESCPECADLLGQYQELDGGLTAAGAVTVSPDRLAGARESARQALGAVGPAEAFYTVVPSPVGDLFVAATETGLCELSFLKDRSEAEYLRRRGGSVGLSYCRDDARLASVVAELKEYLGGRRQVFDLPLDLSLAATQFQRMVLQAAAEVPFGQVVSYGELARRIGHPRACRAVGTALGKNPLPIVIPCHRVVNSGGGLGGYTGGLHIKRALMEIEGIRLESGRGAGEQSGFNWQS